MVSQLSRHVVYVPGILVLHLAGFTGDLLARLLPAVRVIHARRRLLVTSGKQLTFLFPS